MNPPLGEVKRTIARNGFGIWRWTVTWRIRDAEGDHDGTRTGFALNRDNATRKAKAVFEPWRDRLKGTSA